MLTINDIKLGWDFMKTLRINFKVSTDWKNHTALGTFPILMNCIFYSIPPPKYTSFFRGLYGTFIANSCHLLLAVDSILALKDYCDGQGNLHTVQTQICTQAQVHVHTHVHTNSQINDSELWDRGWMLDMRNTGLRGPIVSEAVTQPCLPQITELLQIEL